MSFGVPRLTFIVKMLNYVEAICVWNIDFKPIIHLFCPPPQLKTENTTPKCKATELKK